MQVFIGGPGLAVEPRQAAVCAGAGFLALVAAHAQGFVDEQHIGGFAYALCHQEADDAAALGLLHTGGEFHWWKSPLPECNGILTPCAPLPLVPAKPCDEPTFLIPSLPISMAAMNFIYATAFACSLLTYVSRKPRRFR